MLSEILPLGKTRIFFFIVERLLYDCCTIVVFSFLFFIVGFIDVRLLFFIAECHCCVYMLFFIVVFHCRVSFVCFIGFSLLNDCCMIVVRFVVFSFLFFIVAFTVVRLLGFIAECHCCVYMLFFIVVSQCRVSSVCFIGFTLLNDCCMIVVRLLFFHFCVSLLFSL